MQNLVTAYKITGERIMGTLRKKDINSNTILITHESCADGLGCSIAFQKYCDDNNIMGTAIYFVNYGKVNLPDVANKNVIIADFSFSKSIMIDMYSKAKNLVVLDHHETAKKNLEGLEFCIFNMDKSGAQLLWEYLFDEPEPDLIKYIADRDLWKWTLPYSKEFSAGFQLLPHGDIRDNYKYYLTEDGINNTIKTGEAILQYQNNIISSIVHRTTKYSTQFVIGGYSVFCINNSQNISEVGSELSLDMPFSAQYFITDESIVFSLRSDEYGINVANIAKNFGGGGHFHAAGFSISITNINLNRFLIEKDLDSSITNPTII